MAALDAISSALELMRNPAMVRAARAHPLPNGVGTLLQVAIGDAETIVTAARLTGRGEETLREAAAFFIEQILLDPDSDSYRCLGVDETASARDLRRHMALLTRWLHPDLAGARSDGADRGIFVTRVTSAWEDLKTASRRERYHAAIKVAHNGSHRGQTANGTRPTRPGPFPTAPAAGHAVPHALVSQPGPRQARGRRRAHQLRLFRLEGEGFMARIIRALRGEDR